MKKKAACCGDEAVQSSYRVESIVGVDERGQMVLPKEVREKLGIAPGEKLAVVIMEREGRPCCISLIKADELAGMVQNILGPALPAAVK
jgi:AbrB family looped-hinge helix DNA binding protein